MHIRNTLLLCDKSRWSSDRISYLFLKEIKMKLLLILFLFKLYVNINCFHVYEKSKIDM